MIVTLTPDQAQAVADVLDREVRVTGAQGAIIFGPVLAEIVRQAKAEQQENANGEADDHR